MRFLALATDYDGTLATDGRVAERTVSAMERFRASGRRLILVTGRRLDDLRRVFPRLRLFDYIVAENGAVVFAPRLHEAIPLGRRPPPEFLDRLRDLGVAPLALGEVIVATTLPHHVKVLQAIQESGLELLIAFNRNAVMVLPPGVNKASGLDFALRKLGLSFHEVVGIGDSENDHSFLHECECAVAVANAVPALSRIAAFVTRGEAGAGVVEVIDELVANDLSRMHGKLPRNRITIGLHEDGTPATIPPYGVNVLIAGPSGSGKSTVTAGLVERLASASYQVCVVDPEGDYGALQEVITLGSPRHPVGLGEALSVLEDPKLNLNINLLGVPLADRPEYFGQLFANLGVLRTRTGRPHWLVLDEAHHMLPLEWGHLPKVLPHRLGEVVFVTVHPDHLPPAVLSTIDVMIAVGSSPRTTLQNFARAAGRKLDWPDGLSSRRGGIVIWYVGSGEAPLAARALPPAHDRIRHRRKYAEGDMRNHSFYFRGPANRHNLRAHNLAIFSQIAEGIDEETWLYHLHRGDYSRWIREAVKDGYLADQVQHVEQQGSLHPAESRQLVCHLIGTRYTLPA